jgi:hypothetical protein
MIDLSQYQSVFDYDPFFKVWIDNILDAYKLVPFLNENIEYNFNRCIKPTLDKVKEIVESKDKNIALLNIRNEDEIVRIIAERKFKE